MPYYNKLHALFIQIQCIGNGACAIVDRRTVPGFDPNDAGTYYSFACWSLGARVGPARVVGTVVESTDGSAQTRATGVDIRGPRVCLHDGYELCRRRLPPQPWEFDVTGPSGEEPRAPYRAFSRGTWAVPH
jgi:hypothetical protein